jgi:hypothetical protein
MSDKRLFRRKRLRVALLVLVLAVMACNLSWWPGAAAPQAAEVTVPPVPTGIPPTATPSDTPSPTATFTPTFTPTSTATASPTSTLTYTPSPHPTITPVPTDTPIPPPTETPTVTPLGSGGIPITPDALGNRLKNPGFEGNTRPVIFGEVNIFEGWEPFYCDEPYTPQKCPAPRPCEEDEVGGCNPPELMMRRPEFKLTTLASRVYSGATAQMWFCFYGSCQAGVYQTFPTTPGQICEVGIHVQSWSNYDDDLPSELSSQDDRANSTWQIRVDPNGGTYAFAAGLLESEEFGYEYGIYDQYVLITFVFAATGSQATVFFEDTRIWPIGNNDSYIDEAYAHCNWP